MSVLSSRVSVKVEVPAMRPDHLLIAIPVIVLMFSSGVEAKSYCKRHPNSAGCKVAKQIKRSGHGIGVTATDFGHGVSVSGKDFGKHVSQFARNSVRWVKEDKCDRIKRKRGKEAERRCRIQLKVQSENYNPGSKFMYYAAAEVNCYKPGRSDRWGQQIIRVWSPVSLVEARRTITDQTSLGTVCSTLGNDPNLRDGTWRWSNEVS